MAAGSSRLRIILGTMDMGRRALIEDKVCHDIFDRLSARGINELDTAFMYVDGKSEEVIGRYFKRTNCIIATKANPWSPEGLKYDRVLAEMNISLQRLQLPSVDIFYLHAPDHNTPVEETLSAVQKLYEEGKFKELGLSNFASWQVAEVYHICQKNGWVLPTLYQGMYNGITRSAEGELFSCLRNYGLRFYAYNPLAGGVLTGKYQFSDLEKKADGTGRFYSFGWFSDAYRARYWRKSVFDGIEAIKQSVINVEGSANVSQMIKTAFRWLNHHSDLKPECGDGVIVGGSSIEYILHNIEACNEGPLPKSVVEAFDEAWDLDKGHSVTYYR